MDTKLYNLSNIEAQFKNYLIAENISAVSIRNYLSDLRFFLGWATHTRGSIQEIILSDLVSSNSLNQFRDEMLSSRFPIKTINRRLSTIRKLCSYLRSEGQLYTVPDQKIKTLQSIQVPADLHAALTEFILQSQSNGNYQQMIVNDISEFLETVKNDK
jgi:site-specific recombinase XerD